MCLVVCTRTNARAFMGVYLFILYAQTQRRARRQKPQEHKHPHTHLHFAVLKQRARGTVNERVSSVG